MQTLHTIGTAGRHGHDFVAVLKQHQINAAIDIRLRNKVRYYRFWVLPSSPLKNSPPSHPRPNPRHEIC